MTQPRALYIRHVPEEVAARLEKLAARAGLPLSTFALQELTETARRADNAELLNPLPSCRSTTRPSSRPCRTAALSADGL